MQISRIRLTDSLSLHGIIEELKALLLQVDQTITFQSGIQAFTCPEGFAPPLAPIVQKSLKASPCVMVHLSKHFPGITVFEVVTPASKDAVDFSNDRDKSAFVTATGLFPNFVLEYPYGLLAWHDVQIRPVSTLQVTVITERKPQKIQALFFVHSDNPGFIAVYAQSKDCFEGLFQPVGYPLPHEASHYYEVIRKTHQPGSGKMVRAIGFFVKGTIQPMKIDIRQQGRDDPTLRSPLLGTANGAVFFYYRTLKPLPDQFKDTPVSYAPLKFYHQGFMGNAVKVARKIRVIHFPPSEQKIIPDLVKGSMGPPFGTKTMGAVKKVGLKNRFENNKHCGLNNSVPYAGYPQRAQVAVSLGYVDTFHRGWFVTLGTQTLPNFVKIATYTVSTRLDVCNTDTIEPRRSLVRLYATPRRFQYVSTIDSVIKGIEPKLQFSFRLTAQFPPQKGHFFRKTEFRYKSFGSPFRYGASVAQAGLLSFRVNVTEVRPLGSTGITPLPSYYGPLRIPTVHNARVIDSPALFPLQRNPFASGSTSDLPGSSADLSTRALPNHPGQPHRFFRSLIPGEWQASPFPEGWPLSDKCNEAESGSLALGSRLRRQGGEPFALTFLARTGIAPHGWLPSRDRPRLRVE